jgi:HAD superfamily hydrolase (TIGR01509 family)
MFQSAIKNFILQHNYPRFDLKAVFFDMDGVLLDSMNKHATSWVKAMNEIHIPFTNTEAYMNEGRIGHATINNAFIKYLNREATKKEEQEIYKLKSFHFESLGKSGTMPFAHDLLKLVKHQGIQIFLVTGSGQPTLIDSLQEHFPGIFQRERMVTAFDVEQGKPFPEPYLKALKKSGVNPWEAVVIENAPLGIESGVAAGLFTIAINTGPLDSEVLRLSGANVVLDGGMEELYNKWLTFYQQAVSPEINK